MQQVACVKLAAGFNDLGYGSLVKLLERLYKVWKWICN